MIEGAAEDLLEDVSNALQSLQALTRFFPQLQSTLDDVTTIELALREKFGL